MEGIVDQSFRHLYAAQSNIERHDEIWIIEDPDDPPYFWVSFDNELVVSDQKIVGHYKIIEYDLYEQLMKSKSTSYENNK